MTRPQGAVTSAGAEAVELAESAGLFLDEWQRFALDVALGETVLGKWAAFEVALLVARQNGKGSVLEAFELACLFLFGDELILHSAHEFKTAQEAFRRILVLIENTDDLRKKVRRVRTSHGDEGVELLDGRRLRFVARSTGSGRGFTGDKVIMDEAYNLGPESMGALMPTMSARPNPQFWYTSSAPMATSSQLHAVRERALLGGGGRLAFMEWSAADDANPHDVDAVAQANPGLGIRIDLDFVEAEREALSTEVFRRERLGIPDKPLGGAGSVIARSLWDEGEDSSSQIDGETWFAVDVSPDRSAASIAAAGRRSDRRMHVELIERRLGTSWVVGRLVELLERWGQRPIVLDPGSAAGSLLGELDQAGVEVRKTTAREYAQACGLFFDDVAEHRQRHMAGQPVLVAAVVAATQRPLGDAWAWDRRRSGADISPLVACTLANWMAQNAPGESEMFVSWR